MIEKENIAVVFDTNSYRQLTLNRNIDEVKSFVKEIKRLEFKKNIKAYCVFIVAQELLANLADKNNIDNYNNCLKSLIFLSNHCFDEENENTSLIPPPYFHVLSNVFGILPVDYDRISKKLSLFINKFLIHDGVPLNWKGSDEVFQRIKNTIQKEERNFSSRIMILIDNARSFVKKKNPNISSKHLKIKLLKFLKGEEFEQAISKVLIKELTKELELEFSSEEIHKRAEFLRKAFPFSLGFYKWITSKIVLGNIDMQSKTSIKKRWNWIWDYQVSFLMTKSNLDDRKIMIVTSDKDMIEMVSENGFDGEIVTVSNYLKYIESK